MRYPLAAAAALALFAGACTDTPTTAPFARAPGQRAALSASSHGPALVSNTVKYRDTGKKPARGRSGNAEMVAVALLDREGVTRLSFYAQHATEGWAGSITKAQIKASAPDGKHRFTRNLTEPDPAYGPGRGIRTYLEMHGLGGGDGIQVQANVVGLEPHRTDVVTVTERVKRIPDLTVRMTAPAEAMTGTPVNILAAVREANGDLGTYAVCELLVGGAAVDWGAAAWVDAGDAVTCAMTWTPQVAGTYPVEIRVSTSDGREWDTGNNNDTATIQVHGDGPGFTTAASFYQTLQVDSTSRYESWHYGDIGYRYEYRDETVESSIRQSASMWGTMPARLTGSIDIRASMSTGGQVVDQMERTRPADDETWYWCTTEWSARAMLRLCSGGELAYPWTEFGYSLVTGAVTYHSQGYSRTWNELSGTESVYHWNDGYAYDDTAPVGGDWSFEVRLNTHVVQRSLQLVRSGPWTFSYPYWCNTWEEPDFAYTSTQCSGSTHRGEEITGYADD